MHRSFLTTKQIIVKDVKNVTWNLDFSKKTYIFALLKQIWVMSKKRFLRSIANIRVVAMPGKVRENEDGTKTQLYKIRPMR